MTECTGSSLSFVSCYVSKVTVCVRLFLTLKLSWSTAY